MTSCLVSHTYRRPNSSTCKYSPVHVSSVEADYYAASIPSFWYGRKKKYHSWNIETGFLFGDGARVIRFFDGVIQQLGFWTQKIQANIDYCHVRRRAECTSLGPGLEHPSLRSDSMSGREETCRGASRGVFFQQSIRAQHESCCSVW